MDDDTPEQGAVKAWDFGGKTIYLSESDKTVWDKMNNAQKRAVHLKQIEAIRSGLIYKVTDENGNDGLITQAEALRTGVLIQYHDTVTGKPKIVTRKTAIRLGINELKDSK